MSASLPPLFKVYRTVSTLLRAFEHVRPHSVGRTWCRSSGIEHSPSSAGRPKTVTRTRSGLEAAHLKMCSSLATELLARIKAPSPDFFERLVLALLFKMGYGGSRSDA